MIKGDFIMTKLDIAATLNTLFFELFKVDKTKLISSYWDEDLMGERVGLAPRDLLYLFTEIEREFNILIPEEDVVQGHFRSLKGIEGVITKQVNLLCQ
ncbi:hypothetical protein B4V02_23405 [Paenibacillus kribbensis]|uniref:Carrier domain-containing protein n=2 Tax=Paenibacillus kribbensis TaxID=172713 RepID=A0A222WTD1_9BACL|nr:hypothetical protein B4V02_23405 [Paenibacillus kribbensis]